jgi:hypothetical protein
MKPNDQDRLLIVAISVLCLAALAYGGVAMLSGMAARGVTFKDFDGAAWTQAVGSVLAIAAGAAGIWWQANHAATLEQQQENKRQRHELRAAMLAALSLQRELLEGIAAIKDLDTYAKFVMSASSSRARRRTSDLIAAVDRKLLVGLPMQSALFDVTEVHADLDQMMVQARSDVMGGVFNSARRAALFDAYTRNFEQMMDVLMKIQASLDRVLQNPIE